MNPLEQIINAGIRSVQPSALLPSLINDEVSPVKKWRSANRPYLLCLGKAAIDCAKAVLEVTTCADYFVLAPFDDPSAKIKVHKGSHPIPDTASFTSTTELISWLQALPFTGSLLVLLSGGSSALCVSPIQRISLESKMKVNELLIQSGASIHQINTVRKHLSSVKGGQLGRIVSNLDTTVLVISDVIGDDLSVIGSGPFYADPTTFLEARQVLESFDLWNTVPGDVRDALRRGAEGLLPETPKPGSVQIPHVIIASNAIARLTAREKARELGFSSEESNEMLQGGVENAAAHIFEAMTRARPHSVLVWGGEVTVRLKGSGMGGRNQHLALLMTKLIAGKTWSFAAAGTDGIDGNSPAAGAWTNGATFSHAGTEAFDRALQKFDSYHYFESIGQNIITGPTGTNVMDLYVALVPA